jgi:hypothetical protein
MASSGDTPLDVTGPDGESSGGSPTALANLRRTLTDLASGRASKSDLERAAFTLVAHFRRERHAPEQMLLRIKEVLADAGLRPTYAATERTGDGDDGNLYRDIIAWCIRSYYDSPPASE